LFKEIKKKFTEEPILKIYQSRLPIRVEIDTSDFILGAYIVQRHNNGVWHPVMYYNRKMTPLELNYNIYNKELLAIVTALKEWRVFLQETTELFIIKTDHKNLTGFLTTKELNQKQIRWAEILTEYHFKIKHIKGTDNTRVDTLNRKAELQDKEKLLGAILRINKDGKIRYNHP
jgi:hypothetical protein